MCGDLVMCIRSVSILSENKGIDACKKRYNPHNFAVLPGSTDDSNPRKERARNSGKGRRKGKKKGKERKKKHKQGNSSSDD